MNVFLWVGVGVLAYWLAATQLERQGFLPEWVHVAGPLTTLHTKRGKAYLNRLAQRRRLWRAWANLGVGIALVVMITAFLFVLGSAVTTLRNPQPLRVTEPRNALAIPGVNDFLPLSMAPEIVFGLLVGMVVHEGGHGLLCRVEDIEIESMGLAFLTIVPMGAFVEPDQESQAETNRGGRTRMFAAGVTNNFAIAALAFALLFGPIAGSIGVAAGVGVGGVVQDSPADAAGLEVGDRITAVDGQPVEDDGELEGVLANASERTVTLELDGEREVAVQRAVLVTSAIQGTGIEAGSRITAVEGSEVHTVAGLEAALRDAGDRATVSVDDGETVAEQTITVGARATVQPDGALAEAGVEGGTTLVVTAIGGERVRDYDELDALMDDREPGETVAIAAYDGEQRREYEVTLQGDAGDARIGVGVYRGVDGLTFDDLGLQYYPAERYLSVLGGDGTDEGIGPLADSFVGKVLLALLLPFATVAGGQLFPFDFAGFTAEVTPFYEVTGPLAPLGGVVFGAANVLFWIAWMNFNLGLFNLIPAFPLDGGHILRTATESIVSRLPVPGSYTLTKVVTVSIGLLMGLSLFLMVFGPRYLL